MATGEYKWRGGLCLEVSPIPNTIVIFGASGDLAHRKLLPALYNLYRRDLLHEKSRIIGCARSHMDDDAFRKLIKDKMPKCISEMCGKRLESFLSKLHYVSGAYDDPTTYAKLSEQIAAIEKESCCGAGRVYYLSTPSILHGPIVSMLGTFGLVAENSEGTPWRNVVIEKPFGRDLDSARKLDEELRKTLRERQIYRIDHYLGKETVQNILMLRFANIIFEPVWNRNYIDSVQITAAETVGVEHRAGYFEQAGLLRDMFQNHMLEMLSLVAMEMPSSFESKAVRDEKTKLLRSIQPFPKGQIGKHIVRGQYAQGHDNAGALLPAYLSEPGVKPNSKIETFVASKLFIDNWRWQGVPFFLRSGKRLPKKHSEIAITFKRLPHSIFLPLKAEDLSPNQLILNVQPEEGLSLTIQAKQPGPKLCMGSLTMDFKYDSILEEGESMPEAYERLLLDCMLGDQTLFIRSDAIETAWTLLTPVLKAWESNEPGCGELLSYPANSWGPDDAEKLFDRIDQSWRNN